MPERGFGDAMVFIDVSNLNISVWKYNIRVDFRELNRYFKEKFGAYIQYAYCSSEPDGGSSSFHDMLELSGYRLKKYKPRVDEMGKKHEKEVDTSLSVDMVSSVLKGLTNHVVLVTRDRDMLPAVRSVQAEGARVTLVTFGMDGCDRELSRTCDEHILLSEEGDEAMGVVMFDQYCYRGMDGEVYRNVPEGVQE